MQQLAHPIYIQNMKRVFGENPLLDIGIHEPPRIIARQTIGHLRQVIGAKGQKAGMLGDIARAQRRPWGFDHHTQFKVKIDPRFAAHFGGDRVDMGFDQFHLAPRRDQRDHDFGHNGGAFLRQIDSGFKNRLHLHGVDFGQHHPQTHTAHAQHRVKLGQSLGPAGDI